jgi:multiple sugar transport system substrate-binding protein
MLAAGSQVDIIEIWAEAASQFYADNVFKDLNPYLDAEAGLRGKLAKSRVDAFTWEGKLYGLPVNNNVQPVYYNVDMLSNAGLALPSEIGASWNWANFLAYARRVTRDENGDGVSDFWGVISDPNITDALPWLYEAGGGWFDRNTNPTKSALTKPASMTGLRYYTELFSLHRVALLNAAFLKGNIAFQLDQGPYYSSTLNDSQLNWGMWRRPMGPVNDGAIVLGTGYSITRESKNPDLAWEWIKFVASRKETIQKMYELSSRTPAMLSALAPYTQFMRSKYGNEAAPILDIAANPNNFSGVISPRLGEVTPLIQNTLKELFKGELPVESTIGELERQVNGILQK